MLVGSVDLVRALSDGNAKLNPAEADWSGAALSCRTAWVCLTYQLRFGDAK